MSGTPDPPTDPASRGATEVRPPRDVVAAVRLMYAGAALTALLGLLRAIFPDAFEDALDMSAGSSQVGTFVFYLFVVAGVWLLVARYCRRGSRRARRGAAFFAALYVASVVALLASQPRFDLYNVVSVLIAVVAVATIWFLYRPEARAWFTQRRAPTS